MKFSGHIMIDKIKKISYQNWKNTGSGDYKTRFVLDDWIYCTYIHNSSNTVLSLIYFAVHRYTHTSVLSSLVVSWQRVSTQ
jgi:hypothetical protein